MMQRSAAEKAAAREAFRALPPRAKAEHIWIYYKWFIILGLAALVILGSVIHRALTKKDPVVYLGYFNSAVGGELDRALTQGYLEAAALDLKKQEVYVYRNLYLDEDAGVVTHETAYASRIKLLASVENHQLDLALMSRESWDILSHSGYLLELPAFLEADPDLAETLTPWLRENEVILEDNDILYRLGEAEEYEAVTAPAVNALELTGSPVFSAAGFDETVYLGIIANTQRTEACRSYLAYLFGAT